MVLSTMVLGLAYALAVMVILGILLRRGMVGKKGTLAAAVVTLLVGGVVLGGVPDPVTQLYQAVRGLWQGQLPLQPLLGVGLLISLALLTGRLFCGHACPLGAAQEVMSRLPVRRVDIDGFRPKLVRGAFTGLFVILAMVTPAFLAVNPFRAFELVLGATALFLVILGASAVVYRPWCRLLCPFGAVSELAARRSAVRLRRGPDCVDCGRCVRTCPTGQPVPGGTMSDCYLCGRCLDACPKDCLTFALTRQ